MLIHKGRSGQKSFGFGGISEPRSGISDTQSRACLGAPRPLCTDLTCARTRRLVRAECTSKGPDRSFRSAFWHLRESYVCRCDVSQRCRLLCFSAQSGQRVLPGTAGSCNPGRGRAPCAVGVPRRLVPPEFPLLLVCQLGLQSAGGALALGGAGSLRDGLLGPLAGFANAGFGVPNVRRHGEDENVVEGTAY